MGKLDYKIHLFQGFLYRRLCRFFPVQMNIINKMNIFLDSKYSILHFAEIFASRAYYPALELFKRPLSSVLDLGAHEGLFTLLVESHMLQRFPDARVKYALYEANPRLIKKIARNLYFANLNARSHIYQGAVGKRLGSVDFAICRDLGFSSVFPINPAAKWLRVPYLDIEEKIIIDRFEIPQLIKVDIEGSEADFFKNYADFLSKTCVVVVECHRSVVSPTQWRQIVSASGLELYEVTQETGLTFTEILINKQNLAIYNQQPLINAE